MIGAVIGDVVGSRFEFNNHRSKEFELFTKECEATDDSIMTIAIAKAVLESKKKQSNLSKEAVRCMQEIGRRYPRCGYGSRFLEWMFSENPQPYNSFGNGAAMRVSSCGFAAETLQEALKMSDEVTAVTHNHPEGIKGARATTAAIFLARTGMPKSTIKEHIEKEYGYRFDFTIDEIRSTYQFNETCQETVPQALEAFFESTSFEDTLRTAISVGGDSDTLAAIACSIAEAYYGVPKELYEKAVSYLNNQLITILKEFEIEYRG